MPTVEKSVLDRIARERMAVEEAEREALAVRSELEVAEAHVVLARAIFNRSVRHALISVGAAPHDEIDECTGEVRARVAPAP